MLRTDDHGRVRLLTLDRPEALNAFNTELYDTVAGALDDAAADGDVAVVVLTGEGRYLWADADLDKNIYRGYEPIDLSGFQVTMGIGVRF